MALFVALLHDGAAAGAEKMDPTPRSSRDLNGRRDRSNLGADSSALVEKTVQRSCDGCEGGRAIKAIDNGQLAIWNWSPDKECRCREYANFLTDSYSVCDEHSPPAIHTFRKRRHTQVEPSRLRQRSTPSTWRRPLHPTPTDVRLPHIFEPTVALHKAARPQRDQRIVEDAHDRGA
jgi:hypothetical protein